MNHHRAVSETIPENDDGRIDLSYDQAMKVVRRVEQLLATSASHAPNQHAQQRARIAKAVARELAEELAWLASQDVA